MTSQTTPPEAAIVTAGRWLAKVVRRGLTGPKGGRIVLPAPVLVEAGLDLKTVEAIKAAYEMARWMERAADAIERRRETLERVLQTDGHVHYVLRCLAQGDISTDKALELIRELVERGRIGDATPLRDDMTRLRQERLWTSPPDSEAS